MDSFAGEGKITVASTRDSIRDEMERQRESIETLGKTIQSLEEVISPILGGPGVEADGINETSNKEPDIRAPLLLTMKSHNSRIQSLVTHVHYIISRIEL